MLAFTSNTQHQRCNRLLLQCIAQIDATINAQLNAVLHHPCLQSLEAAWRGLHHLTVAAKKQSNVQLRVLPVSWDEVCRDAERALEFDQSALFKLVYSEEFDRPGGTPFGVMITDFTVTHSQRHIHALELLALVGAASFCPVILNASAYLFGLENFTKLTQQLDLATLFSHPEYLAWNKFRRSDDARFIMLALPRTIMRVAYANEVCRVGDLVFREDTSRIENYCWGNASFAFGSVLIREFGQTQWFSHIRGAPKECFGGGVVTYLPSLNFNSSANFAARPSTDILISDALERQLADFGLTALCHLPHTHLCAFFSVPSLHAHKNVSNERLASMLQHVFCASRFAHYIKIIARDKIGTFTSAEECERVLDNWLRRYCMGNEETSLAAQAKYPLRDLHVEIKEHPAQPGHYGCIIRLKPQYQADHLLAEIKLTTRISLTERT